MPRIRFIPLLMVIGVICLVFRAADAQGLIETPPAEQTLAALRAAEPPLRDRVDLARRLLGLTKIPAPRTVAVEYRLGDTRTFIAANLDNDQRFTVDARLVYQGQHVSMWMENGLPYNADALRKSAEAFDRAIYPTVRAYFGSEQSPGIDGDARLHVLHARNLGRPVAAYFDPDSEFPKAVAPNSNEAQMFFVNMDTMARAIGEAGYEGALAHEFQHMIHANIDANEALWLDEGMAELAAALAGYRAGSGYVDAFAATPGVQLNTWPAVGSASAHYGAAYLFVSYFHGRFGDAALRALVANPLNDLASVTDTLRAIGAIDLTTGVALTAEDVFADWVVTNLLNDPATGNGRYAYHNFPTRLPTLKIDDAVLGAETPLDVTQFGATYLRIGQPGRYTFAFEGEPTVRVIPAEAHSGLRFWWSNRGEDIDTRLTRTFDLRGVGRATLTFWLWHVIEEAWDFGYVQVSTDGSRTWQVLPTQDTVTGGPNNPYGPAFTGASGGQPPEWRQQIVDLTPYAGREIALRFEYLTDSAVNLPGMALDDIRIPEIGYSADAEENDGGWLAEGWARIANLLPASYSVQIVEMGEAPRITRLPVGEARTSAQFTVGGAVSQVVIIISGLTEYTTEQARASYTITLTQ